MFEIEFYEDKNGYSEIGAWIEELDEKALTSKYFRVRLKKVAEYLQILKNQGTRVGYPIVRHIEGTELWELRPTNDRVMFAHIVGNRFLLLNHFEKKTQKTPQREIKKAQTMLKDYLERRK